MVSEGDYVNTGQILARLDTRQQRASLALAKAQEKETNYVRRQAGFYLRQIPSLATLCGLAREHASWWLGRSPRSDR